jgi:hypothetical protein
MSARITCVVCQGRQLVWNRHHALVDCDRCLGKGYVLLPAALADRRDIAYSLVVFLFGLGFIVFWASWTPR